MELFKNTKINFLKYKTPAILISILIILSGIGLIFKNGLRYGVDFSGGTAIHVKFRNAVPLDTLRSALKQSGYPDSGVQGFKDPTQVLIRLPEKATSVEETDRVAGKVAQILFTAIKATVPEGKKDLNQANTADISGYLQLRDPWNTKNGESYQPQVKILISLKEANTGLLPQLDQIPGLDAKVRESLKQNYYVSDLGILSTEYVGPQVGAELREQAKLAIIWSLVGLLVYVWFRFELLWGVSAIVCLAHDVFITLAFFAFTGREISLTVIAAFLTIVGFSLNDTIVIYDRVRDNLKTMRTQSLESVINLTLNQMLNRTILTNGTVTIVTIVLYVFGGEVINDFAFAMLIGCVSGTYSTIYIASALIVMYDQFFGKKKKAAPVKIKAAQKAS